MTNTSTVSGASPAPLSLPARFVGIITAPKETFQAVAAHPRWLGMLLVCTILIAVCTALPMTTEAGKEATLRQSVEGMESFGMQVSDQMYEQMRGRMWFAPYQTAIGILIISPIITVVFAGILYFIFNIMMGGERTFKQLFAVFVHSGVISTLGALFTGPLNYFRGAVTSATNLAVLLPMVDPKSFVGRVLAMTDLFWIWYLLVLAIGLAVLYRRRTQPIAWSLYGIYAAGVLVIAAVMSALGGK
jgi:Yip1 domain